MKFFSPSSAAVPAANPHRVLTAHDLVSLNERAERHLYPSIPFHALPAAHQQLKTHFAHINPGYLDVNQKIVQAFEAVSS